MEDFMDFDDDLFIVKSIKKSCLESYDALQCESGWFIGDHSAELQNMIIKIKYEADYKFFKGDYEAAIRLYKEYRNHSAITQAIVRECIEGIASSYLALHCFTYALNYAEELYNISSNSDTFTTSLTLLYRIYKASGNYNELVLVSQRLVGLHCSNIDNWLKLAIAYALYYGVCLKYISTVPVNTVEQCQKSCPFMCCSYSKFSKPFIQDSLTGSAKVFACLLHCDFHLNSVRFTSFGFTKENNKKIQEQINLEINLLKDLQICKDTNKLVNGVKELYTGVFNLDCKEISLDRYTDKVSSKFTNNEQIFSIINCEIKDIFEKKWLIDSNLWPR